MSDSSLLKLVDAAPRLGLTAKQLQQRVYRGTYPGRAFKVGPRSWMIHAGDLEAIVETGRPLQAVA